MKNINNKGFTLLELIVSIFVGSIVISILIQMLTMSIQARNNVQVESRLKGEAYYLVESLQWNIFELQTQSVTFLVNGDDYTITFIHNYDIYVEPISGAVSQDTSAYLEETLHYNSTTGEIFYNGVRMHSSKVFFTFDPENPLNKTNFDVQPVSTICVPTTEPCDDVVITLTLYVTIELEDGSRLDAIELITTIVV